MAKFYSELNDKLKDFIAEQQMFFTATAPDEGRINLSPKGIEALQCLDNKTIAYLNLTGSGNETAAHLIENGRMTVMFCSFSTKPLILRLYGRGRVIHPRDEEWDALYSRFNSYLGARQIIVLDIESIQTSCGFGVPMYDYLGQREDLQRWAGHKGEAGIQSYWAEKNQVSIDGLPTKLLSD